MRKATSICLASVLFMLACGDSRPDVEADAYTPIESANITIEYDGRGLLPVEQSYSHASIMRVDTVPGATVLDSARVIFPNDLMLLRGRLLVLERHPPPAIRVINVGSWKEEHAFGSKGAGPGEFENAKALVPSLNGDIWVLDWRLRRLTRVLRSDATGVLSPDNHSVKLDFPEPLIGLAWISDSTLVAQGHFGRGRFGLVSADGRLLAEIGGIPPGDVRLPVAARNDFQWGPLAAHPDGGRFVHIRMRAGEISIFNADGKLLAAARTPFGFENGFLYRTGSLVVKPDQRTGYVDVAVTRERIFALFSGRAYRQYGTNADLGLFVHEFDWSGEFQRVLRLDRPADNIAVNESATSLYASHPSPAPEIIRYVLPR